MKSPKSNLLAVGQRRVVVTFFFLFCTEYGAEDITILRDGLAFLSTVSCISAVSLYEIVDRQF